MVSRPEQMGYTVQEAAGCSATKSAAIAAGPAPTPKAGDRSSAQTATAIAPIVAALNR
jgi:hypothetical protein